MSESLPALIAIFVWLLGLCIGSFLNVVIYRMPLGLSITRPARSFCPQCRTQLAFYDNLPLVSWLLLRGRCRSCKAPISPQYPLVEALTGLCFVLTYHLLFIDRTRSGVESVLWPGDAALLLAWLTLTAVLIACSGMDLVSYMVDTRITDVAVIVGLVGYALWPRPEFYVDRVDGPAGAAALAALLVSGIVLWFTVWRQGGEETESSPADAPAAIANAPSANADARRTAAKSALGVFAIVLFVGLTAWLFAVICVKSNPVAATTPAVADHPFRMLPVPAALLALFAAAVLISGQRRDADDELSEAIEEERPQARRTVLRELLWLAPMLIAAAVVFVLVALLPWAASAWKWAATWPVGDKFTPLAGLAYSAQGAMIGALAGWILRIGFTLLFGREALGTGDIYILAAAGGAGGWDIAILGLILSVGFAMIGWLLTLMLKRSAILSFGPWLALGFLAALWLNRPAERVATFYAESVQLAWREQPTLVFVMAGVMLVGTGVAVLLAKLARGVAERAAKV